MAQSQPMSILVSRATVNWYTPVSITDLARIVLGSIELDPASAALPQTWIKADRYYTKEDNALERPWESADTVWLNPPFDDTAKWVRRLIQEYETGNVKKAILLVSSNMGYKWWEELWIKYPVCCLRERVRFVKEDGTQGGQAKRGQTLVLMSRKDPGYAWDLVLERFIKTFESMGRIILP